MRRLEPFQAPQRLHPLALLGDWFAAFTLVGGDDDVHQPLEEVTLGDVACTPRELELLVRLEEGAAPGKREAPFVARGDGGNVGITHGNDLAVWGRPLHPWQA